MSCQKNANQSAGAAIKNGISGIASKAAYMAGGIAIGTGAGFVAGPIGMFAGGVIGGVVGSRMAAKSKQKRLAAAEKKRWQASETGKKVKRVRDRDLDKAKLAYQPKADRFKARKEKIEAEYETAKQAWLGQQKGVISSTSVKEVLSSAPVRAAATTVAGTALGAAIHHAKWSASGYPADPKRTATKAAIAAAIAYPKAIKDERQMQWQQSPEGLAATAKYRKSTSKLQAQWKPIKQKYRQKRKAIKARYQQARDDFLNQESN